LPAPSRRGLSIARLRPALGAHRHALDTAERVTFDAIPGVRAPAGVLVPLFEETGETRVVLTRRAAHLRTHTGEVSFPGGRLEPGESPEEGARREAAEEIGLDPRAVEVIGQLSPLSTFSSGATITPVVGVLPGRPELTANPAEVEHVFDVALAELAADGVFTEERWHLPERLTVPAPGGPSGSRGLDLELEPGWFPMWFFDLPDDTIWGATARMLVELLRLALEL
jgi:8-oxo-dGTP pyrophosphatase MutT (NUDIX family)